MEDEQLLILLAIAGLKAITGSANRFIQVPNIEAFSEAKAKILLVKVCEEAIAATRQGKSTKSSVSIVHFFCAMCPGSTMFVELAAGVF